MVISSFLVVERKIRPVPTNVTKRSPMAIPYKIDSRLTSRDPSDHKEVRPLTKKGHITALKVKSRKRINRNLQKLEKALAEWATRITAKLTLAT